MTRELSELRRFREQVESERNSNPTLRVPAGMLLSAMNRSELCSNPACKLLADSARSLKEVIYCKLLFILLITCVINRDN